ncbi:MAG: hypothetical protein WCQ06_05940 [Actinomycetes bacterium]
MKSLAYLVAFLLGCVIVGGPLALALTYIRTYRRRSTITKSLIASLIAAMSILISLILIINSGGLVSKSLGFIGLATGAPAIVRSFRSVRDVY